MKRRRRLLRSAAFLAAFALLLVAGTAAAVVVTIERSIAGIDARALATYRPKQVTRVLSADGTLIGEIFEERRTVVDYADLPSHVENAFLAAEDADFYHHEGLDYLGILRAALANLRAGTVRQGASTITQQVVKVFLLSPERTFRRKLQELFLARRIEKILPKQKILELYLNHIYLGHGCYGVEEASRYYFGTSVSEIDLAQAALLAGLPKAPARYSPYNNPEGAKRRQSYVLRQMAVRGWATRKEVERAIAAPLPVVDRTKVPRVAPGAEPFVDAVAAMLRESFDADTLSRLGATVHTTVDLRLQRAAAEALRAALRGVDERQRYGRNLRPAGAKVRARARAKGRAGLAEGARLPIVVEGPHRAGGRTGFWGRVGDAAFFVPVPPGSRYDEPERDPRDRYPKGAVTTVEIESLPEPGAGAGPDGRPPMGRARLAAGPEGALVLLDAATGEVRAMVGGYDSPRGSFNRATMARRQPGSAFKPFVYGAAIESRRFTAASVVEDSPEIYAKWRPTNFEVDVYRGPIRLREALAHSVNTVAIKLLDAVGIEAVRDFARRAGISSPLGKDLSLALGTSEVTPLELAGAYGTFARLGTRIRPVLVRAVDLPAGTVVPESAAARWKPPEQVPAVAPAVAFIVTSMMTSVVEEGTARRARKLGRSLAGKTGTSADNKDAWFAAFTPRYVAVAWIGFDRPRRLGRGETGGRAALPAVVDLLRTACEGGPPRAFLPPEGVEVRRIDRATGLLAPTAAPPETTLEEYFLPGTAPTEEAGSQGAGEDALLDLYGLPAEADLEPWGTQASEPGPAPYEGPGSGGAPAPEQRPGGRGPRRSAAGAGPP